MVTLSVIFENANKFYFEGEKLKATVEVSVEEPVILSNILVYFVGECCCSSNRDFQTKPKSNQGNDREIYFNDVLTLFVATDEEKSIFSKGIHPFIVEYQLPCSLPASLESPQGYIRYLFQAHADVGVRIIKTVHYFTVVSKVDLNNDPTASLPVVLWKHENQCIFSFLCLRSGPVRVFVHIAKKGFVPGEMITVNAEVRNCNRLPISWVKASLVQVLKYNFSKVEKRKRVVVEVTRGCVMPYENQVWRSENLYIPAIPPTTISPKGLIHVKYKFYFLIKPSWQEKTVTLKQNLIIGAVPLMECKETEERGQGEGEDMVNNYTYHYSNLEPCVFGPHSILEQNSSTSFSPLYPMYTEFL